jgi:SAM-dependent methyltransferase
MKDIRNILAKDFNMINAPDNAKVIDQIVKKYKYTIGAELGVRRGEFSAYLLQENSKLHMSCVDLWADNPALNERGQPHENNYKSYKQNTAQYKDRVDEYRMLLDDAASLIREIAPKTFDFIFIDATHTYDALKNDIEKWLPFLRPEGLLSGHDYHPFFDNGGMIRIVNELCGPNLIKTSDQKEIQNCIDNKVNFVDTISTCWYYWIN